MATQHQPSLLQYARFHGIAVPAKDPLSYLETSMFYSRPIDRARAQGEWHLENEKLEVGHPEAALLSSIIRSKTLDVQINWDALLPSVQRDESLKLDLLLTAEAESVLSAPVSHLGDRDVGALLPSISPFYPRKYQGMNDTIDRCTVQMMSERLDCSKQSLVLIPSGRRLSQGDIEACFRNMMLQRRYDSGKLDSATLYPYHFEKDSRSHSLPSPVTPDTLRNIRSGRKVSGEHAIDQTSSASQDVEGGHGLPGPCTPIDNRERDTATILTSRLDLHSASNEDHTRPTILRQDNTVDLVRMAQAALMVNDIHTHGEGMDLDQHAISTVLSTPPPTDSVSTSSTPYRQSTTTETSNQFNRHLVEEQKLTRSERGTDVEPMGIYGGQKGNHPSCSVIPRGNVCVISPPKVGDDEVMLLDSPETTQRDALGTSKRADNTLESESLGLPLKRNSRSSSFRLPLTSSHQNSGSSSVLLGSLSTFMESRGVSKPKSPVGSPYFFQPKNEIRHKAPTPECPPIITTANETPSQGSLPVIPEIPSPGNILQGYQASAPALLFLSSSLLKTHTRLMHHLETSAPASRILYREYIQIPLSKTPVQTTRQPHNIPPEADVIISPTTGIILTTSQAVTQLYLPGHKPNDPCITAIKEINSPLRERIFLLLPRYERLYVLISHAGTAIHTEGNTHPLTKIDVRTLQGISSLSRFCASFSKETTVVPLLVQSSPEIVTEWILGLASKHRALVFSTEKQKQSLSNVFPEGLDYVHDQESHWEIFLRKIGLNPFAARAVLDMDMKHAAPEDKYGGDTTIAALDLRGVEPSTFVSFIEMSSEHRIARFGPLIGCRVLKRVENAIEPL